MSDYSLSKEVLPSIQSKHTLTQLQDTASHPITAYLGEETNTCLTTTSFQVVAERNKVALQPLLQTKQSQFPQLLLVRLEL